MPTSQLASDVIYVLGEWYRSASTPFVEALFLRQRLAHV